MNEPLSADPVAQNHEVRWSIVLHRSLMRLHQAIKGCARIGFEESSPSKNAEHYAVWMALNAAQRDAELKLKAYSDAQNSVLRTKILSDPDDDPSAGGGPPR